MLYYLENVELTKCRTYGHSHYKPRTSREKTIVIHKKKLRREGVLVSIFTDQERNTKFQEPIQD